MLDWVFKMMDCAILSLSDQKGKAAVRMAGFRELQGDRHGYKPTG